VDLQALAPLVGAWRTEAVMPGTGQLVAGRTTFAWLDRGGYLVQHGSMDDPAFPVAVMVLGPDAGGERLVQHYFDSRGVARIYDVSLEGGVWPLWRDGPDFPQRFEGRLSSDAARIDGAWEMDDGAGWRHDFELRYVRESAG
jgi:hypothetical protein